MNRTRLGKSQKHHSSLGGLGFSQNYQKVYPARNKQVCFILLAQVAELHADARQGGLSSQVYNVCIHHRVDEWRT